MGSLENTRDVGMRVTGKPGEQAASRTVEEAAALDWLKEETAWGSGQSLEAEEPPEHREARGKRLEQIFLQGTHTNGHNSTLEDAGHQRSLRKCKQNHSEIITLYPLG